MAVIFPLLEGNSAREAERRVSSWAEALQFRVDGPVSVGYRQRSRKGARVPRDSESAWSTAPGCQSQGGQDLVEGFALPRCRPERQRWQRPCVGDAGIEHATESLGERGTGAAGTAAVEADLSLGQAFSDEEVPRVGGGSSTGLRVLLSRPQLDGSGRRLDSAEDLARGFGVFPRPAASVNATRFPKLYHCWGSSLAPRHRSQQSRRPQGCDGVLFDGRRLSRSGHPVRSARCGREKAPRVTPT